MSSAVLTLLSVSLSGSALALLIFALKPLMGNRVTKAFSYYIWLLVLLRLALPFGFGIELSSFVPAPVAEAMAGINSENSGEVSTQGSELIDGAGDAYINSNKALSHADKTSGFIAETAGNANLLMMVKENLAIIWLAGMLASILWYVLAYAVFKRRIYRSCTTPQVDDIALFEELYGGKRLIFACSSRIDTPMLIGVFRPAVIVPRLAYTESGMETELRNILRHELIHYRRHDTLFKWFTMFVGSVHWFNPLVYLMCREISRACELSCDEAVIREMSPAQRRSYGNTLLSMAAKRRLPAGVMATTLSGGKQHLKGRLMGIMNYRKKTGWATALMLIVTLLLTGCASVYTDFEADPNEPEETMDISDIAEPSETPDIIHTSDFEEEEDKELEAFTLLVTGMEALLEENELDIEVEADYDTYTMTVPFDDSILYDTSSSQIIRPEARDLLDDISVFLSENLAELEDILLKGYTGMSVYAIEFEDEWLASLSRVSTMLHYIIEHSEIEVSKLSAAATGDDSPAESGDNDENHTVVRRVDFIIQAYKSE